MTLQLEPWRRPGTAHGLLVLGLHALLLVGLWQTLRHRSVPLRVEPPAVLWLRPPAPVPPVAAPRPRRGAPATGAAPAAAAAALPSVPLPAGESQWVAAAPEPPASAASAPPAERLLDSAATRAAIRLAGQSPLLHERAAAATGQGIERSDTALAEQVAQAGLADCMKAPVPGGLLGIPLLAVQVARGKCGK
ncbi:MAG: hypothetical protein IV094_11325 [Vitreoscilla sp.]|nr:hypothetical protein [Vitreoscilla sp.]